jgi:phage-related holin
MEQIIKFLRPLAVSVAAIFAPIQGLLLATGSLVFIDLITGVIAAHKRGSPITSAGLRRSVTKICVYQIAIMTAFLAEKYMSDVLPFVKMAAGVITLTELTSVLENLNSISGENLLKALIDKLGSKNQE